MLARLDDVATYVALVVGLHNCYPFHVSRITVRMLLLAFASIWWDWISDLQSTGIVNSWVHEVCFLVLHSNKGFSYLCRFLANEQVVERVSFDLTCIKWIKIHQSFHGTIRLCSTGIDHFNCKRSVSELQSHTCNINMQMLFQLFEKVHKPNQPTSFFWLIAHKWLVPIEHDLSNQTVWTAYTIFSYWRYEIH